MSTDITRVEPAAPSPRREADPLLSFVKSEAGAAGAGVSVYALFRGTAFVAEWIDRLMPLADGAPAEFLAAVLGWGGAIGASATFVVITVYQLIILIARLWERRHDE